MDPNTGEAYYYNPETDQEQYTMPVAPPSKALEYGGGFLTIAKSLMGFTGAPMSSEMDRSAEISGMSPGQRARMFASMNDGSPESREFNLKKHQVDVVRLWGLMSEADQAATVKYMRLWDETRGIETKHNTDSFLIISKIYKAFPAVLRGA